MSTQKGEWLFSCLWWTDHSAEGLTPALQLSFDSVPPKQSDTPPFRDQEPLFHFICQCSWRGLPGLNWSGICCESWKIWQPAEDNGLNSCSKSKADPANSHHMYSFARRWVCWAVGRCCLSFPSAYGIRLSQTLYIPNVLPLRRRAPASYHIEKGTSVADFTHALWGHCMGLPASPPPHTHTQPLSLPY